MSKLSKAVKGEQIKNELRLDETVTNFMGGDSYTVNPLTTLKMIMASSIFGEASYYRPNVREGCYSCSDLISDFCLFTRYDEMTTTEIMENAVDMALDFDFYETIMFAAELRNTYNMRLNPQIIMVRAALHPKRKEFTKQYKGLFNTINQSVMARADEPATQLTYYLYLNGGNKNDMPSILKRSIAAKLSRLNDYQVNKYKNHEIGIINAVRLTHAHSETINRLMHGTLKVEDDKKTWEQLKSDGASWKEILQKCDMGHMALLRNMRGIFTEIDDRHVLERYMDKLKSGVLGGKQFPYRYYTAIKAVKESECNFKPQLIDCLEECIDISLENMPKLNGKTMCLSDNSGSAWGCIPSEYGNVTIAEIDNLSSVITAACSKEGYVGKFGDKLIVTPISKRNGILQQAENISAKGCSDVGSSTEGGIWEFFDNAIKSKEHWDNIFIYSDQQAGHGGLYGTAKQWKNYKETYGINHLNRFINVFKLICDYRKNVNPNVNIFSIQTAGYNNVVIPEYAYRTNIMYGWTGKEAQFASRMIDLWDDIEYNK